MFGIGMITVTNGRAMKPLSSIDLNLLVALDALLTHRSVTRAAAEVGMTQPGMSNALARLRKTFDDPLLVRAGAVMSPTPRAAGLRAPVHEALRLMTRALNDDRDFSPATDAATFRISCSDYSVLLLISPLVRELARDAPNVVVDVSPRVQDPVAVLQQDGGDMVIEPAQILPDATIPRAGLFEDQWLCCISAGSALRGGADDGAGAMTLEEYLRRDHVAYSMGRPGVVSLSDAYLDEIGLERRTHVTVESFLMAPVVLQGTDMVTIVPSRAAEHISRVSQVRFLRPPVPVPTFTENLWWHPRHTADPAHSWMRQRILEVARREAAREPLALA